jgi:hypothetical protein
MHPEGRVNAVWGVNFGVLIMASIHSLRVFIMRIQLPDQVLYRIGSSHNIQARLNSFVNAEKPSSLIKGSRSKVQDLSVIASTFCLNLDTTYKHELMQKYVAYKYTGEDVLPSGNGELFVANIYEFEQRNPNTLLVPCLLLPSLKGR